MSQLIAPTHTFADNIPLGRRIAEIMQEKGAAYTIAAMSKRLGINRETLRLMLKGDREIYTFELERIAHDLKLPVERILQADIVDEYKQLQELHVSHADPKLALDLAEAHLQCAIGLSERCMALNMLGLSYYIGKEFILAAEMYSQAFAMANLILDKYGESRLFLYIALNMLHNMTSQKKFSGFKELVAEVEPYIESERNIREPAIFYSLKAKVKEMWEGDHIGARKSLYKSNEYYQLLGHPSSLARSQYRVAVLEYRQQNYADALRFFQLTWPAFQELKDLYHHVVNGRDYGKLLIRMNDIPQAIAVLRNCIDMIHTHPDFNWKHLVADLYLLAAIAEQNPFYADQIIAQELGSTSTQKLAGKFLIEQYARTGDEAAKATAERHFAVLRPSPIDVLLANQKHSTDAFLTLIDFIQQHSWNMPDSE